MKISKNKIMIAVIIALCAVVAGLVIYMVVGKNNKNNTYSNWSCITSKNVIHIYKICQG